MLARYETVQARRRARLFFRRFVPGRAALARQRHREGGTLARRACDGDGTVHQFQHALDDGQPQALRWKSETLLNMGIEYSPLIATSQLSFVPLAGKS